MYEHPIPSIFFPHLHLHKYPAASYHLEKYSINDTHQVPILLPPLLPTRPSRVFHSFPTSTKPFVLGSTPVP